MFYVIVCVCLCVYACVLTVCVIACVCLRTVLVQCVLVLVSLGTRQACVLLPVPNPDKSYHYFTCIHCVEPTKRLRDASGVCLVSLSNKAQLALPCTLHTACICALCLRVSLPFALPSRM